MLTTYSLRDAAERCDTTLQAMRNRADRGGLQTVLLDGERRVPHSELERAGLLPDAELHQIRGQVDKLTRELAAQRQLVVSVERDREAGRQAHELKEQALLEQRASATSAQAQAETAVQALEADLRGAGPLRALFISEAITLEPGDLILTGTPSGVGMAMDPRRFLASGDVVRIEIETLGSIEHAVA